MFLGTQGLSQLHDNHNGERKVSWLLEAEGVKTVCVTEGETRRRQSSHEGDITFLVQKGRNGQLTGQCLA